MVHSRLTLRKDTGLTVNSSPISVTNAVTKLNCMGECSHNPCCVSGIWHPKKSVDNCRLFAVQFDSPVLVTVAYSVYFMQHKGTVSNRI